EIEPSNSIVLFNNNESLSNAFSEIEKKDVISGVTALLASLLVVTDPGATSLKIGVSQVIDDLTSSSSRSKPIFPKLVLISKTDTPPFEIKPLTDCINVAYCFGVNCPLATKSCMAFPTASALSNNSLKL